MKNRKKQKIRQLGEIADKFLYFLERSHRGFVFLFTVVVIANVFFLIVIKGTDSACGLFLASKSYIESKIKNENVEHYIEMRKIISDIEEQFTFIEEDLGWPKKDVWLNGERRLELLASIRRMDELSYEAEWVANNYFTDYSIQYYPYQKGNLSSYVYETRYLKKAIDRFVRVAEIAIALDSFDKRQIEVVEVELNEVGEYLANTKKFEQELHLLN